MRSQPFLVISLMLSAASLLKLPQLFLYSLSTHSLIVQKYSLNYVNVSYNELVNEIHYDKKNIAGTINFILVTEIGKAQIYPIKEDDLGGYFN